jgi:hypothetical protein
MYETVPMLRPADLRIRTHHALDLLKNHIEGSNPFLYTHFVVTENHQCHEY